MQRMGESREALDHDRNSRRSYFRDDLRAFSERIPDGYDGSASWRLPGVQPLEPFAHISAEPAMEHLVAVCAAHALNGGKPGNERAACRNRAGDFGFVRSLVRC